MIDTGVALSNDKEIAETLNKYFCNVAKKLLTENSSTKEVPVGLFSDHVKFSLEKYKDHPSITSIKNEMTSMNNQN